MDVTNGSKGGGNDNNTRSGSRESLFISLIVVVYEGRTVLTGNNL